MKKNFSTPGSSSYTLDRQYVDFERMRGTRSHADLSDGQLPSSSFSRTSSLADLAYVALPGLTSRVSRNNSVVSLANLSDAFKTMPAAESPMMIEVTSVFSRFGLCVGVTAHAQRFARDYGDSDVRRAGYHAHSSSRFVSRFCLPCCMGTTTAT